MKPSSAEYWHMGAITMRLASLRLPTSIGLNKADKRGSLVRACGVGEGDPRPPRQPARAELRGMTVNLQRAHQFIGFRPPRRTCRTAPRSLGGGAGQRALPCPAQAQD